MGKAAAPLASTPSPNGRTLMADRFSRRYVKARLPRIFLWVEAARDLGYERYALQTARFTTGPFCCADEGCNRFQRRLNRGL